MRSTIASITAVALLGAGLSIAAAGPAEDKGWEIAKKVEKANDGFQGETSTLEMTLINAHGDKTTRKMTSMVREKSGDGDLSRIEFRWPADVKGTRMLTWSHKKDNDDQWLYLPAIKRVKRISSRNKSGSFMGSEFSYEDLGSQEPEKFKHKFLGDETLSGRKVWKTQRIPTDKRSGYSKQIVWIDKQFMNAVKIQYYDRKGELLKTGTFSGYEKKGSWYRVGRIDMVNHQTRKKSSIVWKDRKLGVDIDEDEFDSDELSD